MVTESTATRRHYHNARDTPSRLSLFLWTLAIAAMLLAGYWLALKKSPQAEVKTYQLEKMP